jgi:subtilase family protein
MIIDYSLCNNLQPMFLPTSLSLKTVRLTSMILMGHLCLFSQGNKQAYKLEVCPLLIVNFCDSYGPSFEMYVKPAVAAPGGNILSTYPVNLGSFAIMSGTSMATPYVAGSAALLLSSKGKQVAKGALSLFESTAQKVPSSANNGDPLQTLAQQGAGLINVFAALNTTTIISPTELLLNSTALMVSV